MAAFQGIRKDGPDEDLIEKEKEVVKKKSKNDALSEMTKIKSVAITAGASKEITDAIEKGIQGIEKS
jgi:hypothetical protein